MTTDIRSKQRVFVYGASGHAKVVIDAIERGGQYEIVCLVDDAPNSKGGSLYGYPVIGGREELIASRSSMAVEEGIVAIGDNSARQAVATWLANRGFSFITAVHAAAVIGRGVSIGPGAVVMAGAVLNSDAVIGEHVIINTAATVDHDCRIGPFVHIAPGAHLCGAVTVGQGSLISAGVTVIPNRSVGRNVVVGAGSTVIHDLPDGVTVTGSPAEIQSRPH